uniref:Putative secreted protein n=1 Tax=Anopheles marajoara TaxID=58244 RepID=A0A2M4CEH2_9DIPT
MCLGRAVCVCVCVWSTQGENVKTPSNRRGYQHFSYCTEGEPSSSVANPPKEGAGDIENADVGEVKRQQQ